MSETPMYMEIVEWTKGQIFDRTVSPGDKFYSEAALCRQFCVSRQTVRRALDILARQGYIQRIQGSGTYIAGDTEVSTCLALNDNLAKTVGIITVNNEYPIFPHVIEGIREVLSGYGYALTIDTTQDDVAQETHALARMLDLTPAGLIVEPTKSGLPCLNTKLYRALFQRGIPVVFTNSRYADIPGPCICLDDDAVGYNATQYLIEMGHKNIAGVFAHTNQSGLLRYRGYARALLNNNLALRDDYVHWYRHETLEDTLRGGLLWATVSTCTAIVCYNDQIATRLMDQLTKHGLRVPEDISIISPDNTDAAQRVGLTSIDHPSKMLGHAAADVLRRMIMGGQGDDVVFAPELIIRNSVRRPGNFL